MVVTPGAVSSGRKEQTYRRGVCRSRRNISQLVGADGVMTPKLVVKAGKRDFAAGSGLKRQAHRRVAAEVGKIIPRRSEQMVATTPGPVVMARKEIALSLVAA